MQYARSEVDYVIREFIFMLPSDMNLQTGKVKNYNNKILISSPSFKIGTNLKINLDEEKDKLDVKSKKGEVVETKPNIRFKKGDELDTNEITYEEEKVTLILGITSIFTVWWVFK